MALLTDRARQTLDPRYRLDVVHEALASGTAVMPAPFDLVKPEAILPVAPISAGGEVAPLGSAPCDLRQVPHEWQGRRKTLDEFMRTAETDAVAVLRDGDVVAQLRRGAGRPLYIPELSGTPWAGTTIRNLLEMESGVHWDEGTPVLAVNTQVQQWVQMWLGLATEGALGQTRNEFFKSLPRVAPQGTRFSYNSGTRNCSRGLVDAGRLDTQIDRVADWQEANEILALLAERRIDGKAVLRVG